MNTRSDRDTGDPKKSLEEMADEAKNAADDIAQKARETKEHAVSKLKSTVNEAAEEARVKAAEVTDEIKQQAHSTASSQKAKTADRIDGVASSLRQTGRELRSHDEETFAQYADTAAEQIERVSGYLKDRDISELMHEVKRFAHRQPEVFLAGSLAVGFLLGRFLRSSDPSVDQYQNSYRSAHILIKPSAIKLLIA